MRLIDADAFKMEDFRHCLDCDSIIQVIKHSPTVEAKPVVHAHWDRIAGELWMCSNCAFGTYSAEHIPLNPKQARQLYCSYCGARMDLEE